MEHYFQVKMASFVLAFFLGALIGISQSSSCHAQCDYDQVTAKADCSSRSLDCIPINYPDALVMDLSHNNISVLEPDDFNGTFTRLVELYLDFNNIADVSSLMRSTEMGSLDKLSVQHNIVSRFDTVCELSSLRDFSLDYNLLTSLNEIPQCRALERFSANFNELLYPNIYMYLQDEFIPSVISLRFSGITYIRIRHYDYLPNSVLNLTLLLDNNDIDYLNLHFSRTFVYGLKLSLSHNRLQRLYTQVPTELNLASNALHNWNFRVYLRYRGDDFIHKLDISNNSFDSLIQPDWAEGLQILYADDNMLANLSSTTPQGFVNLTELHVANNRLLFISSTALSQLTMLRSLYLDGNALTSLLGGVFLNQAELVELSMTDNQLSALHPSDFMGLVSLERLYFSGNRLQYVQSEMFRQIPQVITMDFSQNKLGIVNFENCHFLPNLQNLTMAHNSVRDISKILGYCNRLKILDLSFNQIQVVTGDSLAGRNRALLRLELAGNPLQCDCRLTSLRDWLRNNPPSAPPRCHGPPLNSEAVVTDLDIRDFSCEAPKAVITNAEHLEVVVGQTATLTCTATGVPAPNVTWLTPNGTQISDEMWPRFAISPDMTLHIARVQQSDQGMYTCLARNILGETDGAMVNLSVVTDKMKFPAMSLPSLAVFVVPAIFVTFVVTLAAVALVIFLRRRSKKKNQTSSEESRQHPDPVVRFRKGRAIHSDGGYVNEVNVGQYEEPTGIGNQPQNYQELRRESKGDVYESMSVGQ